MTSEEIGEFLAFAHVGAATDFAGMLGFGGIDPATDREEAVGSPMSGVGDDLVKEKRKALGLEYGIDEDRVGVGKAEKGCGGCDLGFEVLDDADHGGMEWHDTQSVFYLISSDASGMGLF